MATASAHKKAAKRKSGKLPRAAKKTRSKAAAKSAAAAKSSRRRKAVKPKAPSGKAKTKRMPRAKKESAKKPSSAARRSRGKERITMKAQSRKPALKSGAASALNAPPRLLRQTKTTAAALALLEKGIELIYKKDFKKARGELNTLLEKYPKEMDILARARSYMQICDREEAVHKKTPVTTDQMYTLGILEHNKANYDAAISYFLQSLELHPKADYIYYSVAASLARKGDLAGSLENLHKAVNLNEDSRVYAKNDADFSSLQTNKEFMELVGLAPSPDSETES
jgi:tetratricopeptide (TPR) repeat protein